MSIITTEQRNLVTGVVNAEDKVTEWQNTATERWHQIMTLALANADLCKELQEDYVTKKVTRSEKELGRPFKDDDERAEYVKKAKDIWKARKSEVKNGGGRQSKSTEKGPKERLAEITAAVRRAVGTECTPEQIDAAVAAGLEA